MEYPFVNGPSSYFQNNNMTVKALNYQVFNTSNNSAITKPDEFSAEQEYASFPGLKKTVVKEKKTVAEALEALVHPTAEEPDDNEPAGGKKHFRLRKDPYDEGQFFYKKSGFTIEEGITVLVGCNGSGKTTLMMLMKEYLRNKGNPLILEYSDVIDGRSMGIEKQMYRNHMEVAATMMCSSEGERIWMNVGHFIGDIGRTIRKSKKKDIWIFLDGIDSGMSIDCIMEAKNFFHELPSLEPDKHFYFIISANAFELARDEKCLDVANMKFVKFSNYEKYMKFVLASREQKDKRDSQEE